jgi:Schlafen, AlbA_2
VPAQLLSRLIPDNDEVVEMPGNPTVPHAANLGLRSKGDVERLIRHSVAEDVHLEFKQAESLSTGDPTASVTKLVSGMANSDGGVIIFGITEREGRAAGLMPVLRSECSRERLEDLVNGVTPRVAGLTVDEIEDGAHSIYVVNIPKSRGIPHQAKDYRYYRRSQTKTVPMADFEIADVRRRVVDRGARVAIDFVVRGGVVFDLVLSKIGTAAAQDVTVLFEPPIQWCDQAPTALCAPIQSMPVGRKLTFMYGTAPEMLGSGASKASRMVATIRYRDALDGSSFEEVVELDAEQYRGSQALKTDAESLRDVLREVVGKLSDQLGKVNERLKSLRPLVEPTGLGLSVTALRDMARLLGREWEPRCLPTGVDAAVFAEVLGVGFEMGCRLEMYFRHQVHQGKRLDDVEGMTPELLASLHQAFQCQPTSSGEEGTTPVPLDEQKADSPG